MYESENFEYVTASFTLVKTTLTAETEVKIPDGHVTNIGLVQAGNNENRIINLTVLQNNSTIIQPSDIRFSERSAGGNFRDSLRPVDIEGSRTLQVRLNALVPSGADDVTVQVLFMIRKPNSY